MFDEVAAFFQGFVVLVVQDEIVDFREEEACAGRRVLDVAHQIEIDFVQGLGVLGEINKLDGEIGPFAGRVGFLFLHDFFFAQDGRVALYVQARAGRIVRDQRVADDNSFIGFQVDHKGHEILSGHKTGRSTSAVSLPSSSHENG